jgi:molybdopterin-guanine dinucleotide biosynthesis protein A
MGRDKAVLAVDGRAMAVRVADALWSGGCRPVHVVGGDEAALAALGLVTVADEAPGEGPLGGIITAVRQAAGSGVVVAACDLPWLDERTVRDVADALGGHDVAVARTDRIEPLCAMWSGSALAVLERLFADGVRAVHRVFDELDVVTVDVQPGSLRNINTPADLRPSR